MTWPAGQVLLVVFLVVAVLLMASLIYPIASALLLAAVLAGAMFPWQQRLARRLHSRWVAAGLLTAAVTLLLAVPATLIGLTASRQLASGIGHVQDTLSERGIPGLVDEMPPGLRAPARKFVDRYPGGEKRLKEAAEGQMARALASLSAAVLATSSLLLDGALMLVAFFFMLGDGAALVRWIAVVAPLPQAQVLEIFRDFRNVSVALLLSSLGTAGAQSLAALIGYLVAGVPHPLMFAALTFLIAFIPAIGATSVVLLASFVLFVQGQDQAALYLALWGLVVVAFVDNLVKPLLLQGRMEIHGALIFFALVGGLATFGPVGLVAGPLILSFFLAAVRLSRRTAPA
jgi:predicted PurR-regulated permease PerM